MLLMQVNSKKKAVWFSSNNRGTSILEVLVSCVVFSLLAMVLFSVMRYSLLSWRGIEDRTSIQMEMRKVQHATSALIRSTSYSSVLIHDSDSRKTITFKTFLDENGRLVNDDTGTPVSQGYVIFTLVRPADDPCKHTSPTTSADTRCYHKILLRVDLTNNAGDLELVESSSDPGLLLSSYIPQTNSAGKTALSSRHVTVDDYKNSISGGANKNYISNVMIVGRNLLSFDPEVSDLDSPGVQLTMRGFRIMESEAMTGIGENEDLTKTRFAVQMTSSVIPMNP
jgi:type II secretory pathway component PulJ